jgi:hypothetical protein
MKAVKMISALGLLLAAHTSNAAQPHCRKEIFGTNTPRYLEPLWAQDFMGSGFSRDFILTEQEKSTPLTMAITGEDSPTLEFRSHYPSADWPIQAPEAEDMWLHAYHTTSLLVGPWLHSMFPASLAHLSFGKGVDTRISTNQSGGCSSSSPLTDMQFASAGNSATKVRETSYPNCLWVGSLSPLSEKSFFSSVGPSDSTIFSYSDDFLTAYKGKNFGGTSGASPVAAGAAAFALKANPSLTSTQLKRIVLLSARSSASGLPIMSIPRLIEAARLLARSPELLVQSDADLKGSFEAQFAKAVSQTPSAVSLSAILRDENESCDNIQKALATIMSRAHLEEGTSSIYHEILATFYKDTGFELSALAWRVSPNKDIEIEILRKILADDTASTELRSFAVVTLAKQNGLTDEELKAQVINPKAALYLRSVTFRELYLRRSRGLPRDEQLCNALQDLERQMAEHSQDPNELMAVAFWGSDIKNPLPDLDALKDMACSSLR